MPEQRAIQANQTTQAMPVTHMASDLVPVAEQSVVVVVPHLRHTKMAVVGGGPCHPKGPVTPGSFGGLGTRGSTMALGCQRFLTTVSPSLLSGSTNSMTLWPCSTGAAGRSNGCGSESVATCKVGSSTPFSKACLSTRLCRAFSLLNTKLFHEKISYTEHVSNCQTYSLC